MSGFLEFSEGFHELMIDPMYQVDPEMETALPPDLEGVLKDICDESPEIREALAGYIRDKEVYFVRRLFDLLFMSGVKKPKFVMLNAYCVARVFAPHLFGDKQLTYEQLAGLLGVPHREALCIRTKIILDKLKEDNDRHECPLPEAYDNVKTALDESRMVFPAVETDNTATGTQIAKKGRGRRESA